MSGPEFTIKECLEMLQSLKEYSPESYWAAAFTIYVHYETKVIMNRSQKQTSKSCGDAHNVINMYSYCETKKPISR